MNDNEILKALECCANEQGCENCPANPHRGNYGFCTPPLIRATFDLVTRQRAKIERFEKENHEKFNKWKILDNRTKQRYAELYEEAKAVVRAEAIKEFAERLKEQKYQSSEWSHGEHPFVVEECDIDELVQEMVGDEDG